MRLLEKAPLRRGFSRPGTEERFGSRRGTKGLRDAPLAHDWHTAPDRLGPSERPLGSETWEHLFVTAQGSAYARFRRALDSRNATVALATATELDFVSLADALELVLLLLDNEPRRYARAALRWHGRYCSDLRPDLPEALAVLSLLGALQGGRPKPAARALAELLHQRELLRASEALIRWAS